MSRNLSRWVKNSAQKLLTVNRQVVGTSPSMYDPIRFSYSRTLYTRFLSHSSILQSSVYTHEHTTRSLSTCSLQTLYTRRCLITSRWYSTESTQADASEQGNPPPSTSKDSDGEFKLVYTAPLRSAIRAVKVFSLSTATAAVLGGPVLVWLGNPSVPLSGRIIMSSLVMLVGISTTALLHWLVKGYVIQMHYNEKTKMVQAYTLSVLGRKKPHEFNISDARPPSATAFSSFQANGKAYFVHADVFESKEILSKLLGVYADIETSDM